MEKTIEELKTQIKEIKAANERDLIEVENLWRGKLESERTKTAKLVEALEEIRKPAMIISLGKATNRDRAEQLTEDHKRVRMIAQSALTTNTEKGGVNGEV